MNTNFLHLYHLLLKLSQSRLGEYKLLRKDRFTSPGVFLIDKEGIIQYYTVNNLLFGRSINGLLRIFQSI